MISAAVVRRIVLVVCVAGIAGMIVTNIAGSTGGSLTFGLITAAAVLCSLVATAVTSGVTRPTAADADELGARVEAGIATLVDAGADERAVRAVVADAVRYGRTGA